MKKRDVLQSRVAKNKTTVCRTPSFAFYSSPVLPIAYKVTIIQYSINASDPLSSSTAEKVSRTQYSGLAPDLQPPLPVPTPCSPCKHHSTCRFSSRNTHAWGWFLAPTTPPRILVGGQNRYSVAFSAPGSLGSPYGSVVFCDMYTVAEPQLMGHMLCSKTLK